MDLDPLLGGFDAPTNAMLGVVFVKGISAQLFVVLRFIFFCGFVCDSAVLKTRMGF